MEKVAAVDEVGGEAGERDGVDVGQECPLVNYVLHNKTWTRNPC